MATLTAKRKTPLSRLYGRDEARYLELLNRFPLRPIRSEGELDEATRAIHSIIDHVSEDKMSKAEADYLDVLSDLVEAYETVHYPMEDVSDADMLQSLLEARDVPQTQLAKGANIAVSTISEVLSGKRQLTRSQIGKISRFFKVDPGVFSFDR